MKNGACSIKRNNELQSSMGNLNSMLCEIKMTKIRQTGHIQRCQKEKCIKEKNILGQTGEDGQK